MSLVLELEKPFLRVHLALVVYDIHVNIYAACVVLLADLHVVKKALCLEVTCADSGHIHKIEALVFASEFLAYLHVKIEGSVDLFLHERFLDIDILKLGRECGVTAVVAPICIEDTEFGL